MREDLTPAVWRKSTYSTNQGQCVEVTQQPGVCGVRDSTDPTGAILWFSPEQWAAFTAGVRAGEFD
jgi:hypothetical protein